jgi:hypothetical protein
MNLQKRITTLLTRPHAEWQVIAAERTDVPSLYREYIAVLAAIPALSLVLGLMVFGVPLLGRWGLAAALTAGVASYVSALVSPLLAAFIIERLAPRFASGGDTVQALKLVAYASTPLWVGGVVYLVVVLAPLIVLAALYAIYLFYVGLPYVMKTPPEQVVPFMVVSALAIIVLNIVLRFVISAVGVPSYF